eukprot:24729-Chlamydomonas_euryale.AAC.1
MLHGKSEVCACNTARPARQRPPYPHTAHSLGPGPSDDRVWRALPQPNSGTDVVSNDAFLKPC